MSLECKIEVCNRDKTGGTLSYENGAQFSAKLSESEPS